MSSRLVDMRIAQDSTVDVPGFTLTSSMGGYVFGNIGLQTTSVSPQEAGYVRVMLNAYLRLAAPGPNGPFTSDVTFRIYRNGTLIFTTVNPGTGDINEIRYEMVDITAVDFPPVQDVLAGQIQYIIVVSTTRDATLGARSFAGTAVVG
ncbi:hypothetical protein ACFQ3J_07965 [Paenibacillus provencensis]|uniref:Uncharacterized protein n=1 Tax=Paenibacillus provencensis TaxID=441151 RepID=A0ABW3PK86_9BACL|nr:hypothetical protein [Paenibacillus sp. MER 78]MCM3129518.1 hypothetical protein [Paenibacillus sp. MER 78]